MEDIEIARNTKLEKITKIAEKKLDFLPEQYYIYCRSIK